MSFDSIVVMPETGIITAVNAEVGQSICAKDWIFEYELPNATDDDGRKRVRCPRDGTVKELSITFESSTDPKQRTFAVGTKLLVLESCTHAVQFNGICTLCNKDVSNDDDDSKLEIITKGGRKLSLTNHGIAEESKKQTTSLLKSRKLVLVLDIDHTILHASGDNNLARQLAESKVSIPGLHALPSPHVKLRPGLHKFLQDMSSMYKLYIYTHGVRAYAEGVLRVIDPDAKLFGHRSLCRGDFPTNNKAHEPKILGKLCQCDKEMVVILDDTLEVWMYGGDGQKRPNILRNTANVLRAHRYNFFLSVKGHNALVPQHFLEGPVDTPEVNDSAKRIVPLVPTFSAPSTATLGEKRPRETVEPVDQRPAKPKLLKRRKRNNNDTSSSSVASKLTSAPLSPGPPPPTVSLPSSTDAKMDPSHAGPPPAKRSVPEPVADNVLRSMTSILTVLHDQFYAKEAEPRASVDSNSNVIPLPNKVSLVLNDMRASVLQGVQIVFSGMIDLQVDPRTQLIWQLAEQFGAICHDVMNDDVTHVVAAKYGSEKVRQGLLKGKYVVHADWLWSCIAHVARADESVFKLTKLYDPKKNKHFVGFRPATASAEDVATKLRKYREYKDKLLEQELMSELDF